VVTENDGFQKYQKHKSPTLSRHFLLSRSAWITGASSVRGGSDAPSLDLVRGLFDSKKNREGPDDTKSLLSRDDERRILA